MKFLHAADIHLDSPMAGLLGRADLPAGLLDHVTRRAFSAMIDLALAEDVAFIIIAGDLYDGDWKDFSAGLFFAEEMRRLARPCYLLRGNHDAQSVITRGLKLPGNVHEFSSRTCSTFTLPEEGVALHGHSFPRRAVPEDLSQDYPDAHTGLLNIGVLHTSATGSSEHETYAPCTIPGLALKGYDYWALGHIHDRRVLSESPWVVFPGNLQGRHARETGAKGCTIVTVQDRRISAVEHRAIDIARWVALEIDVTGADMAEAIRRIGLAIDRAVADADGRPILARITLSGETAAHRDLLADAETLAAECRNAAIAAGASLFVERLRIRTRPPAAEGPDLLTPVEAAFASGLQDPEAVATLLADLAAVREALPPRARESLDVPHDEAGLAALAAESWQIVARALADQAP